MNARAESLPQRQPSSGADASAPPGAGTSRSPEAGIHTIPAGSTSASPGADRSAPPEPEFEVLAARPVRHAAAPMLALDLQISEPSGRHIYMIGLTVQLMLEPARRRYDEETRERLAGLFGAPERWAVTTHSLLWAQLSVLVPAFTGSITVALPVPCSYDLELAAAKYLYSLRDGEAPLALHFNGVVYYPGRDGGMQMVLVPWSRSIGFPLPVAVWRETVEHYYPATGWAALRTHTLDALERERVARGLPTFDACVAQLLQEGESA
jgi:Family of unknown function (DUF6084)